MTPNLVSKLYLEFPHIFSRQPKIWCDDGWFDIIYNLCREVQARADSNPTFPRPVAVQVKEKFGSLRFYLEGSDGVYRDIIQHYEQLSKVTCEVTGRPGELSHCGALMKTVCAEQAEKLNMVPVSEQNMLSW